MSGLVCVWLLQKCLHESFQHQVAEASLAVAGKAKQGPESYGLLILP